MARGKDTGFMEDYTYELASGQEAILESHMMEVDPTLAATKPRIVVSPLSMEIEKIRRVLYLMGKQEKG